VRFDGSHKHDRYLTGTLGEYLEFVPVCPEVEAGFPIPVKPSAWWATLKTRDS